MEPRSAYCWVRFNVFCQRPLVFCDLFPFFPRGNDPPYKPSRTLFSIVFQTLNNKQTRAKPGAALQAPFIHSFIHSLINWFSHSLVKISLCRLHTKRLEIVLPVIKQTLLTYIEILNLEGHLNNFIDSKVTAILLNGWILPTGEVASGRVCPAAYAAGLFCFVSEFHYLFFW